jgi:hypothetical protein
MKDQDCSKEGMSGCCPTVETNLAVDAPELTQKSSVIFVAVDATKTDFDVQVQEFATAIEQEYVVPPQLSPPSIQVLRI